MSYKQHIHNHFGLFQASSNLSPQETPVPDPNQSMSFKNYDSSNCFQDPHLSKPINQFQYISPQHTQPQQIWQQNQSSIRSVNNLMLPSHPTNVYPTLETRRYHRPSTSSEVFLPTPATTKRVPKFDRTY